MPPSQTITKEKILDAALTIVRTEGIERLSARNIAKTLKCSTQPIYSTFKNMEILEKAVIQKAFRFIIDNYMIGYKPTDNNFLNMGLSSIEIARKEQKLFQMLYLSGKVRIDFENNVFPFDKDELIAGMKKDPFLAELGKERRERILFNMWIYTHGLSALVNANPSISNDFIFTALDEMGRIVIEWEFMQKMKEQSEPDHRDEI